jgi:hypothetical protein
MRTTPLIIVAKSRWMVFVTVVFSPSQPITYLPFLPLKTHQSISPVSNEEQFTVEHLHLRAPMILSSRPRLRRVNPRHLGANGRLLRRWLFPCLKSSLTWPTNPSIANPLLALDQVIYAR